MHSLYLVHSDDDDDEGGPFVIVMRMIGVMNVAPWECLPIAILMQTPLQLLPRATSSTNIFSTQKFSFSPPLEKYLRRAGCESAVGKMLWPV